MSLHHNEVNQREISVNGISLLREACECLSYAYRFDEDFREAAVVSTRGLLAECGIEVDQETAQKLADKLYGDMRDRIDAGY